jgi:hypothetical protein
MLFRILFAPHTVEYRYTNRLICFTEYLDLEEYEDSQMEIDESSPSSAVAVADIECSSLPSAAADTLGLITEGRVDLDPELAGDTLVLPCAFPLEDTGRLAAFLEGGQEPLLFQDDPSEPQVSVPYLHSWNGNGNIKQVITILPLLSYLSLVFQTCLPFKIF